MRHNLLWLLVGCYGLAAVWPGLGVALRGWNGAVARFGHVPLSSLVLLATLLFVGALLTDFEQTRYAARHPIALVSSLAAVWVGPALLVLVVGQCLPSVVAGHPTAGLMVSFALVASMPVANSSVGWTHSAGGNLGLALALVVVTILLSPWITPGLLALLGASLGRNQASCEELVHQFSGFFFIVWVLLPTLAGLALRQVLSVEQLEAKRSPLALVSAAALLTLNYTNSVLALPKAGNLPVPLLLLTTSLAASLAVIGVALGWALARFFRLRPETRTALMFGLSMKHTGLALILAATALAHDPIAILLIILATLMQHVVAAIVQRSQAHTAL